MMSDVNVITIYTQIGKEAHMVHVFLNFVQLGQDNRNTLCEYFHLSIMNQW